MTSQANGSRAAEAFLRSADDLKASLADMSEDDRMRIVLRMYELMIDVESPWDTYMRLYLTALETFESLQLFEKWNENGNRPATETELAQWVATPCDPALLRRLLRLLAANRLIKITNTGKFEPTPFFAQLADNNYKHMLHFHHKFTVPMLHHMPMFLKKTNFVNPTRSRDTMFDSAFNWEGGLFGYLEKYPEEGKGFNVVQKLSTSSQARWTSVYPCHTLLDSDPNLPLLVDVGGSIGQDLKPFMEKYPETASRLYLQDLPSVIVDEEACQVKGVNKLAYDFFKPQPIKYARAYYMHHILHDWPDKIVLKILENQKVAMKPGYSKILIHDHVLDDSRPVHPHAASYDITMMAFGSAKERTEREWHELIESIGLKIVKIWGSPSSVQGILEVELMEGAARL
ncbi:O-methyltransferase [Colletotrichum tropicale]|nr:O-methyltransferase [Colletotrichum tropicale]